MKRHYSSNLAHCLFSLWRRVANGQTAPSICLLCAVLLLLSSAVVQAQSGSGDNFDYSINASNANTITITNYTGTNTVVIVPTNINNLLVTGIGNGDFSVFYSDTLTSVAIPSSVTSIGDYAFSGTMLTNITIPNSVTSIGVSAFYACSSLTNAAIGNSVTNIGDFSFAYTSLSSVTIPGSIITIGDDAFYSAGLTDVTIGNGVTSIGDYAFEDCHLNSLTIPNNVNNIGNYVFANMGYTGLTNLTIPNSVTNIGDFAFQGLGGLASVTISGSVANIGDGAFEGCSHLTNLTIASGVTTLGEYAFAFTDLISVTIPNSVTSIGVEAFSGNITAIVVDLTNSFYSSLNGVLFDKSQTTLLQYPIASIGANYTVPSTVTIIGDYAFAGCYYLTNIVIPNGVICIGNNAFEGCYLLASATIPDSVTSIGSYAFAGMDMDNGGLTNVTIPNNVTNIGDYAFWLIPRLTNVTIGGGITNIGIGVFSESGLTSVTISDSVTSIGLSAFQDCRLTSVTIPGSVISIGDFAFSECIHLTNVTIGDGVTTLGEYAFAFTDLISVTIPNSVTSIGDYAFASGVEPDGQYFSTPLTSVTIPNSVTNIGEYAFENCPLTNIVVPGSVANIGDFAFDGCYDLTNVTIASGVTSIGEGAFEESGLISVTIPNTVTSIGDDAFNSCSYLTCVTIPSSITNIGEEAFAYCTGLTGIYFQGNAPSVDSTAFLGDDGNVIVSYLPGTSGWSSTLSGAWTVMLNPPVPAGSLQLNISPAGAITSGAQWQVDGGIPQPSGATVLGLSVGNHTVSFGTISGWTTPISQIISVSANSTATASGTYVAIAPTASLKVIISPPAASADGAQWQVDGGLTENSGVMVNNLTPGSHTVSFTFVFGWNAPANQTVTITNGMTTTITGLYTPPTPPSYPFNVLHSFSAIPDGFSGNIDGVEPSGGLVLSGNTLYGAAQGGGSSGFGTVFAVNIDGTGFKTLHNFNSSDGSWPQGKLVLSGNTLFGTAYYGGSAGYGTVFALSTNGTSFTNLYSFTFDGNDPGFPQAGLSLSGDMLYGTAYEGGANGVGTVFAVNTNGTGFTNLYAFTYGSDGAFPNGGVILSGDTLYGTASAGGDWNSGTVFKVNTDGSSFTTLHSFTAIIYTSDSPNSDGGSPLAGVTLSGNMLYGTANVGGNSDMGTVFMLNTNGTGFTTLYSFTPVSVLDAANSDGADPSGGLVLSGNTLYGTCSVGGSAGNGTIFAVKTNGTGCTTLYTFTATPPYPDSTNSDGINPSGPLILSGSILYGTAGNGGSSENGTIFALNLSQQPDIVGTSLSNTNLVLNGINGLSGPTYYVLMSTNLTLPLNQWTPIATNVLSANGNFTIIITNTVTTGNRQRFYVLEMQ